MPVYCVVPSIRPTDVHCRHRTQDKGGGRAHNNAKKNVRDPNLVLLRTAVRKIPHLRDQIKILSNTQRQNRKNGRWASLEVLCSLTYSDLNVGVMSYRHCFRRILFS